MKKKKNDKKVDKKIVIISVTLFVILVLLIVFFVLKGRTNNDDIIDEENDSIDSYNAFIVDEKMDDILIKDYNEYLELTKKLNIENEIEEIVFNNYNIFVHFETIKMCNDNLDDYIEVTICSSETGISVRRPCCDNPKENNVVFIEKFTKDIDDLNEIIVYNHDIYSSCK